MVRARSSQPGSVRRRPSRKLAVTGKKMTSTAMATFEPMPKPSQSTSRGARAKTGMAWLSTRMGQSQRCNVDEAAMPRAAKRAQQRAGEQAEQNFAQCDAGIAGEIGGLRPQGLGHRAGVGQHEGRNGGEGGDCPPNGDEDRKGDEGADHAVP